MINDTWILEDEVAKMERVAVRLWGFFFLRAKL